MSTERTACFVTGGTGFIGRALLPRLTDAGFRVRVALWLPEEAEAFRNRADGVEGVFVGDISGETDWEGQLDGFDIVLHLAARAHVIRETVADPLSEFRRINLNGTCRLAEAAVAAGVRRFVYISSIGVHGRSTRDRPWTENCAPAPVDPYAVSKLEAEKELGRLAGGGAMEVVCIRPPLVYGPGVGGNFRRFMKLISKGLPLPLGLVRNARSFIGVDNLADFIVACATHPAAAGEAFVVADGEDLSTPELIRRIGRFMGRRVWLLPIPLIVLRGLASLVSKADVVDKLCESLQVDASKARTLLSWAPIKPLDDGLEAMVDWFLRDNKK